MGETVMLTIRITPEDRERLDALAATLRERSQAEPTLVGIRSRTSTALACLRTGLADLEARYPTPTEVTR